MAKKWIKKATANAHGQFAEKAKEAGKTTKEFADEKADAGGKLGKEAVLAKTLMGMHHAGGGRVASSIPVPKALKLYGAKTLNRGG